MKRRIITWQTWRPAAVSYFARAPWSPLGWRLINYGPMWPAMKHIFEQWFRDDPLPGVLSKAPETREVSK